ncbi:sensor histidine kinase [Paenibacillus sp. R14(2021)]|uniref:sensor histidine kinase n=1 Tax=Paenibacillus sp. R14(2021) TaxID=2859228 RepID=UPI001C61252B|nr:sensor histidine kinase [Paenibacillus sp. R14(2021)]
MFKLLPLMLERVGLLLIAVFLLSRMKAFRHMIHQEKDGKEKWLLIAIFGAFGIISNYTGIEVEQGLISVYGWQTDVHEHSAIANTRILGVALGGFLGGPIVGLGVGAIAGFHRLTLGGYTAVACGISTLLAGIVTGLISPYLRLNGRISLWRAVPVGIVMECIQMGLILLIAKPFEDALKLVTVISVPMITINGFGTLLFLLIIQTIQQDVERTRALQTHKALYIADLTLPYFRKGLNPKACQDAAAIILKWTNADAISITDQHRVLAHAGAGSDHHIPLQAISTLLTKKVLEHGEILTANAPEEIQCEEKHCPLRAAIVLPLSVHNKTAGTLKLYFTDRSRMDQVEQELAEGLSRLISTQLEWADAELQSKLLKDAEIKALQAQVHPHFLFNAINTISVLCRTDPEKARQLLLQLSVFFRSNLQGARQMLIPLHKELEHVEAYLVLEKARFPEKFTVDTVIDPSLEQVLIPPFTIQPLVENAIRHAFSAFEETRTGHISIRAYREDDKLVLITKDDGKGIPADLLASLGNRTVKSEQGTGTALHNIQRRIAEIYNGEAAFLIRSEAGTEVTLRVPIKYSSQGD